MSIAREELRIGGIPALVLGEPSNQVYLYVHGQNGNKEEACGVAESLQRYGCQTLSLDMLLLPILCRCPAAGFSGAAVL